MGVEGVVWLGQNKYWESCNFSLTIWLNILFVTIKINKDVLDTFIQINTQIIKITKYNWKSLRKVLWVTVRFSGRERKRKKSVGWREKSWDESSWHIVCVWRKRLQSQQTDISILKSSQGMGRAYITRLG